jgi:hypothetical protein
MREIIKGREFVIISACKGIDKDTDIDNTILLEDDLIRRGLAYKLTEGCYKGILEESFYVEINRTKDFGLIAALDLATKYKQESVLYVNDEREASLHYTEDFKRVDHLGTFTQVSETEAQLENSYTYDLENDGFYICK